VSRPGPAAAPKRGVPRWAAAVIALGLVSTVLAGLLFAKAEQIMLGAEAYLFGYPLVIMDVTRVTAGLRIGPENSLCLVRKFPDARAGRAACPTA
jgi:hypothetical protein